MFALIGCGAKKKIGVKKTAPIEIESTTELENFLRFFPLIILLFQARSTYKSIKQYLVF